MRLTAPLNHQTPRFHFKNPTSHGGVTTESEKGMLVNPHLATDWSKRCNQLIVGVCTTSHVAQLSLSFPLSHAKTRRCSLNACLQTNEPKQQKTADKLSVLINIPLCPIHKSNASDHTQHRRLLFFVVSAPLFLCVTQPKDNRPVIAVSRLFGDRLRRATNWHVAPSDGHDYCAGQCATSSRLHFFANGALE